MNISMASHPEDWRAEVLETLMWLSSGKKHVNQVGRIIHVGDRFVKSVHDEQGVILKWAIRSEVCFFHRPELFKHSHHIGASFEHSVKPKQYLKALRMRRHLCTFIPMPMVDWVFSRIYWPIEQRRDVRLRPHIRTLRSILLGCQTSMTSSIGIASAEYMCLFYWKDF